MKHLFPLLVWMTLLTVATASTPEAKRLLGADPFPFRAMVVNLPDGSPYVMIRLLPAETGCEEWDPGVGGGPRLN